jgi:hypothetical protein
MKSATSQKKTWLIKMRKNKKKSIDWSKKIHAKSCLKKDIFKPWL